MHKTRTRPTVKSYQEKIPASGIREYPRKPTVSNSCIFHLSNLGHATPSIR